MNKIVSIITCSFTRVKQLLWLAGFCMLPKRNLLGGGLMAAQGIVESWQAVSSSF